MQKRKMRHLHCRQSFSSSSSSSSSSWTSRLLCLMILFSTHNTKSSGVALGRVGATGQIDVIDNENLETGGMENDVNNIGTRRSPPTSPPASSNDEDENDVADCDCRWGGGSREDDENEEKIQGGGARLAYLITVHNKRSMDDAAHLFHSIRSPNTIILLHIDTKVPPDVYPNSILSNEITKCPCGSITHVESVHDCQWGKWSMNGPTHWAMEVLTYDDRFRGQWDVFMNLSGDTMPVYSPAVISKLFDPQSGPLRDTNFVTSSSCETGLVPTNVHIFPHWWHKWEHYNTNPDGDPVISYIDEDEPGIVKEKKMVTHFGSQWMALRPDFTEFVVKSLKDPNSLASRYKDFLIRARKLMTDEVFIPTLLVHTYPFNETLPKLGEDGSLESLPSMKAIRYERMDEHVPSAFGYFPVQQRYEVPESSEADQPKLWGPYFLGVYDLADIVDSGALFVRKVSIYVDPNIVYLFPVSKEDDIPYIRWPKELQISKRPDWEAIKAEMIRKTKEKEEGSDQEAEEEVAREKKEEHKRIIHDEQ